MVRKRSKADPYDTGYDSEYSLALSSRRKDSSEHTYNNKGSSGDLEPPPQKLVRVDDILCVHLYFIYLYLNC